MKKLSYKVIAILVAVNWVSAFLSDLLTTPLVPVLFGEAQSWEMALLKMAFRSFFTVTIFALFMILGVREITGPILQLSKAANRIAQGEYDVELAESRRRDEIGQLEASFRVMAKELQSTKLLKKDFISNVSHEYKTPLAVMSGYAKLLGKEGISQEEREEYSQFIVEEAERLSQMTSNVLLLSKLENQNIEMPHREFALDEQLRQAALLYLPKCEEKEIALSIDAPALRFRGNEDLLMHVWTNLLGNAVKFSSQGGAIAISLQEREQGVEVSVADEGIGMSADTLARVFEQFYQGDASRVSSGNGLGLSLAQHIVKAHQGDIRVESQPGEGSTFTVTLPRAV